MTNNNSNPNPESTPGSGTEELVGELTNVILATFGVGAALAKTVAHATAGGRKVPEPEMETNPLNVIIHYSMATILNVINVVTNSVSEVSDTSRRVRQPVPPASARPAAASSPAAGQTTAAQPGLPVVHRGTTLRVPLSIENPGSEPMNEIHFVCLNLEGGGGEGIPLELQSIRLEPTLLSVAPHDFEKLTIFIEVPPEVALGRYQARIGLDSGDFETILEFEVLPAAN